MSNSRAATTSAPYILAGLRVDRNEARDGSVTTDVRAVVARASWSVSRTAVLSVPDGGTPSITSRPGVLPFAVVNRLLPGIVPLVASFVRTQATLERLLSPLRVSGITVALPDAFGVAGPAPGAAPRVVLSITATPRRDPTRLAAVRNQLDNLLYDATYTLPDYAKATLTRGTLVIEGPAAARITDQAALRSELSTLFGITWAALPLGQLI